MSGDAPTAVSQFVQSHEVELATADNSIVNPPYALQIGGQGLIAWRLARTKKV